MPGANEGKRKEVEKQERKEEKKEGEEKSKLSFGYCVLVAPPEMVFEILPPFLRFASFPLTLFACCVFFLW